MALDHDVQPVVNVSCDGKGGDCPEVFGWEFEVQNLLIEARQAGWMIQEINHNETGKTVEADKIEYFCLCPDCYAEKMQLESQGPKLSKVEIIGEIENLTDDFLTGFVHLTKKKDIQNYRHSLITWVDQNYSETWFNYEDALKAFIKHSLKKLNIII